MSIFDRFARQSKPPQGYSEVKVEFTEDEMEAINRSLKMYAAIANDEAPEGTTVYIQPKLKDGLVAKALTEYVEDLMRQLRYTNDEAAVVMDKAIKAQMK